MMGLVGMVVVVVMVFGGYLAAGGKMGIIIKSLPFELTMIGGAAIGAFIIGNSVGGIKHTLKDIGKVFKGPRWKPDDYRDLLCLLYQLLRLGRQNAVALEIWLACGQLRPHHSCSTQLLVDTGLAHDRKVGNDLGGPSDLLVEPTERRARVARHKRCCVKAFQAIDSKLLHR